MPAANMLAALMLASWPVVSWILFTRLDPARALVWTILGAYMFLPPVVAFDLPMLPDMDKNAIAALSPLAATLFLLRDRFSILPEAPLARALLVLYVASPFASVVTNTDAITFVETVVPPMRLYDSLAVVANQTIALLPFMLGRRYLGTDGGMRTIIAALVLAGLIYSIPMLYEVRMSPQLNQMVYGFFQHDFSQAIRFDGFRPFVFMPHGLWVAFFAMMCFIASMTLLRSAPAMARPKYLVAALYLGFVLVMCRSAGPLLYALLLAPAVLVLPRRLQLAVAVAMVTVVIVYPLLRGLHLVPIDLLIDQAMSVNAERGRSLEFRLRSEELLLARAEQRPWFGWGIYGRSLLHHPVTGEATAIADGGWIITLGAFGWAGYVAEFGLLALPVFLMGREAWRGNPAALSPFACAVTLVLAANLFDLLPNDTIIPFTWLMAGAVMGYAEMLRNGRMADARANDVKFRPGRTVL